MVAFRVVSTPVLEGNNLKRFSIAITALLALCAAVLAGCTEYEFQDYELKAPDADNAEKRPDGTFVLVRIHPSWHQDNEKQLVERREPYAIYFTVWGRFDRLAKIDVWLMVNGQKISYGFDPTFDSPGNIHLYPSKGFPAKGGMTLSGATDLESPWESIETLELHARFTATVDGVTREYNIVTPIEKSHREGTTYPFWEAMMSV